jgi:hypothetical protein
MTFDERRLGDLLEESADTHADAMRSTAGHLGELVETGLEQRAHGGVDPDEARAFTAERDRRIGQALVGAGAAAGIGAAVLALSQGVAAASTPADIQILQTNASIEALAIATYKVALTLPFIGGSSAIPVVKAFATQTMAQHTQHAQAFNAALTQLGGKTQNAPDPVLSNVVKAAEPSLTTPAAVVALAIELENGAAETYVHATSALTDKNARSVTASIMGVEAQHVAILLAVQALVKGGDASLITLPPKLASLPAAAGSVGFPNGFYPTSAARPAAEGAVS